MSGSDVYESLVEEVCAMERSRMIERLSRFTGDLRLDFSEEFLRGCDDERLRHLLLAALWRCRMKAMAG